MPRIILNLWRSGEGGVDDDKREINKNLLEITQNKGRKMSRIILDM